MAADAEENETADEEFLEFLEYLGTWDEKNDDWNKFFDSLPDPDSETTDRNKQPEAPDDAL